MKIGFFDTCLEWIPHFETDLELMDKHIDHGDEVIWFNCNGELPFCQPNPYHKNRICSNCIKRKNRGLKLLNKKVRIIDWYKGETEWPTLPDVKEVNDLRTILFNGLDIGLASVSSLVSVLRDPSPDMEKHKEIWTKAYIASFVTFKKLLAILAEEKFDRIYLFNGRYAVERAVYRVCFNLGIECIIHDRGRNKNHYMLYKDTLPHSRTAFVKRFNDIWNNSKDDYKTKIEIGSKFFEDRARGKEQFWVSFVHEQKAGVLPDDWDPTKKNIAIFTSSEDELISISDEWKNPVYSSQLNAIKKIIEDSDSRIKFYLRVHPNLIGVKNKDIESLYNLKYPNLFVIPATSSISTYALLQNSDKVIVFGSTVGVEATYWGTPAILAGVSYYHGLDITYDASTHEEVLNLIKLNLKPKNREIAIKYGYYFMEFGYSYKNYIAKNLHMGKYKNKLIYGNWFITNTMNILSELGLLGYIKRKIKRYKQVIIAR